MIDRLTFWLGERAAPEWADYMSDVERDEAGMRSMEPVIDE